MRVSLPLVAVVVVLVVGSFSVAVAEEAKTQEGPVADSDQDSEVTSVQASVREAQTGSGQEIDPRTLSAPLIRHWGELRILGDVGYDWNPLFVDSDEASDGFGSLDTRFDYSFSRFRRSEDVRFDKQFQIGVGIDWARRLYRDSSIPDRLGHSYHAFGEWAPKKIAQSQKDGDQEDYRLRGGEGFSLGLQYRHDEFETRSGSTWLVNERWVPAVAYNLARNGECDLTQWTAFYFKDRLIDRTDSGDPARDQDGDYRGYGFRYRWIERPNPGSRCVGGGIFRNPVLYDYKIVSVLAQYGHQDTKGTEFDRDVFAIALGGSMPVLRIKNKARMLLDGNFEFNTTDHSNVSVLAPVARADHLWRLDLGLVGLVARQSSPLNRSLPRGYIDFRVRLGGAYTEFSSTVPGLDFRRPEVTLTLDVLFGLRNTSGPWKDLSILTESPGSNVNPTGGPELPEILTEP